MQKLTELNLGRSMGKLVSGLLMVLGFSSASAGPLDTLQPGQWYEAPSSNMSALDPCPARNCTYSGVEGNSSVMSAWNGGAYDTTRDRLIVWGGGHNAYAGNEVYVFNIGTMTWSRATEPTTSISQNVMYYPDGKPSSRHTYNMVVYAPNVDRFISVGAGSTYGEVGGSGSTVDALDFGTNTWSTRASIPDAPGYGSFYGAIAAYDAGNGHIWFHNTLSGTLREYDPVTNTWQIRVSNYLEDYSTAAIDPVRRLMVTVGGKSGILIWDLNSPTSPPFKPAATTGDTSIQGGQAPGFVYDSASKLFVGWNGGSAVYTLTPPLNPKTGTWVWTKINTAASNTVTPTTAEASGTYGRFQYIPSKNVFVAVNRTTESVYFYRLSNGGTTTAPTATFSASATTVAYNGSTTLSWSGTNTTGCTASGGWSGSKTTSGSAVINAITADTTFTLSCSGAGGSVSKSVAVIVTGAPPTVTLSASPTTISSGGSSTLTWFSTGATSCAASAAWSGVKGTSGTLALTSLTTSGTYTLTCTGTGGSASQSATINVTAGALLLGITTLKALNQSASTQTNVPATFGHYFKVGDVPSGQNLVAKLSDGTPVAVQVDKKATHSDGSLKHAVLSLRLPNLASSGSEIFTLYSDPSAASGTPVSLSNLLSTTFDAQVSLDVGGTVYSASAKNLLTTTTAISWLSGSQVSEWIVGGPVKTSSGTAHPHLTAYFHVRAYAGSPITRVRVDTVVENNWTFRNGATAFTYVPTVSVGGTTIPINGGAALTQYHHTRWHQVGWWGSAPQVYVQPNTQYLRDSKAVPNYADLTLQSSVLNNYVQTIVPMSNANLRASWGDTGYSAQIGILPEWDAAFVISGGDMRAYNATLVNSSAGGSYSYHYRDENTGYPVSLDTYSGLNEQDYGGGLVQGTGGNPNSHEPGADPAAHQPMLGYLAYLLSGDYFYLEEMQFLANYDMIWNSVSRRTYLSGPQDGIVGYQNRGAAWGIRTLGFAATLTPDSHPLKNYLVNKTNNNIAEKTAHWASPSQNSMGAVQDFNWIDGYTLPPKYSPWQNDFFVIVFNRLVELGFSNATTMRDWLNKWPVGRLGGHSGTSGYCWKYATQYNFGAGIVDALGVYDTSFTQLYQRNFPAESASACPTSGLMHAGSYPTTADAYYSNLQAALAMAVDAGAATQSLWTKFLTMGTPDYTGTPVWAIVPRVISGTPAPTIVFSANPGSIAVNGSATLGWSTTNATGCTASDGWTGSKGTSGPQTITNIAMTTTFTLSCSGAGGSSSQSATVVVLPAPTVTLSASPISVVSGGSSVLTWSSTNASTCWGSNATASTTWSGTKGTAGSETLTNLTSTDTYSLTCTGTGGSTFQNATITITTLVPTVTISASPASIAYNGSSTLTWSSTNATSCIASGAWSGTKATSGSQALTALTATNNYTLTCSGTGGNSNQKATITVAPAAPIPTVSLSASSTSVAYNGSSTLNWTTTNATSCTASGAWSGSKLTTAGASQTLNNLTTTGTYSLACSNAGGTSAPQSVVITVAAPPLPAVNFSASQTSIAYNSSTTLAWSSTDATYCTAAGSWSGPQGISGTNGTGALTSTTTYSIACTGVGGTSLPKSVTVTVAPPPTPVPTVTMTASPVALAIGGTSGTSTLTWSSTNATSCLASNGWTGTKATMGNEARTNLTGTTIFVLTCSGAGGSASQSLAISVAPLLMPTVSFSLTPSSINYYGSTSLSWSSTGSTKCFASDGWSGEQATSGTIIFSKLKTDTTYSIYCTGPGGNSDTQHAVVALAAPLWPRIILSAGSVANTAISTSIIGSSSLTISPHDSMTIAWSTLDADSCTASSFPSNSAVNWTGEQPTEGEVVIGPLTVSTSLTLACSGPAGNDQQTVVIIVDGPANSPTPVAKSETKKVGGGLFDPLFAAGFLLVWMGVRRARTTRFRS